MFALGINYSPCAVATAIISVHPADNRQRVIVQESTPAHTVQLFCINWTPNVMTSNPMEDAPLNIQTERKGTCGKSGECLQHFAASAFHLPIFTSPSMHGTPVLNLIETLPSVPMGSPSVSIRDGPLHDQSVLLAHALIKRE